MKMRVAMYYNNRDVRLEEAARSEDRFRGTTYSDAGERHLRQRLDGVVPDQKGAACSGP